MTQEEIIKTFPVNKKIKGTGIRATGEQLKIRIWHNGSLIYEVLKCRRYASVYYSCIDFIPDKPKETFKMNSCQNYAQRLLKYKKIITKHRRPDIWKSLQTDIDKINDRSIALLNLQPDDRNGWDTAGSMGLPRIEGFHRANCSMRAAGLSDEKIQWIKECMDKKDKFSYRWRGRFDYSVEGQMTSDGKDYSAWFSAEFKGCGNGHYYLLLNENYAMFVEDD